jgi:predicted DCC family thiol-disulfide oxidoreductase YuxK
MRTDRAPYSYQSVVEISHDGPFTVMDAHCGLCARGAKWIATNDRKQEFGIIPLQSDMGRRLMTHYGIEPDDPTTWLMIENGIAYCSADAVLRTATRLGGRWQLLGLLHTVPKGFMDWLYLLVARNRYRISRANAWCEGPHPEVKKRLLDKVS